MKNSIRLILLSGLLLLACNATVRAQEQSSAEEQTVTQEAALQPAQKRSVVIKDGGKYYCGYLQMTPSGVQAVFSSVPLLTVGYKRMNKSVDTYNSQCVEPDVELALGLTGNGVGMTIRF